MRIRVALLMMTMLMMLGAAQSGAEEALRVDMSPRYSFAPASVRVRARITPRESNRALRISAESGQYYRSSTIPLEGANAQTLEEVYLKDLPSGDYAIAVTLVEADGSQTTVTGEVQVMESAASLGSS